MKWTNEQQLVIDVRDKNVLVSAAAGSGKTAVLVERIISKITDAKNPVDVDRILVVTFTNAAASEMKERIRRALEKALLADSSNTRLRTQVSLVHNAQIRTIDSFCSYIVKNYFYEIDADPAFRIAGKGELKLMQDEAITQVLEDRFKKPSEDFTLLANAYIGKDMSAADFKAVVHALYTEAMSNAWPEVWLDNCLKMYEVSTIEEMEQSDWIQYVVARTNHFFAIQAKKVRYMLANYPADDTSKDGDVLRGELAAFEDWAAEKSYIRLYEQIASFKYATYNNKTKSAGAPVELQEELKQKRDEYKKEAGKFVEKMFVQSPTDTFDSLLFVKKQATELVNLVKDYKKALWELKKKRKVFDFNDIEHMALEILVNGQSEAHEKRQVALELTKYFDEVMVDEYQDSNDLQETILTAVCRGDNYFTVGDVKQSIYSFRQASPALFNDKFIRYADGDDSSIRIDLDSNFRSRSQVLEFCNRVFYPLMSDDMGGVTYDEAASLKAGAKGYEPTGYDLEPEIIVGDSDSATLKNYGYDNADYMEAQMVADRIRTLIKDGFLVSDNTDDPMVKRQRKVRLSDIVLLFRGVKGRGSIFTEVLKKNGIPAYLEEETGFFDREEISDILSALRVIDNPYNDIPMAAVLHSPLFNFSSDRLAQVRIHYPAVPLSLAIMTYGREHEDEDIRAFMDFLEKYRESAKDTPIHELIQDILASTGYMDYVRAQPLGENKVANLHKLIDEAIRFESTSYQGLSGFVNYIEGLKTYQEDPGVAKLVGENEEAVRIMTIHKSKGLEFPVVFLCGTGHEFRHDKGPISYNNQYGLAMDYWNPITRRKSDTVFMKTIRDMNMVDKLGEEQRILYVALTRAKEKLIITGCVSDKSKDKDVNNVLSKYITDDDCIDIEDKRNSTRYLEWIMRALYCSKQPFNFKLISCADIFLSEVEDKTSTVLKKKQMEDLYRECLAIDASDITDSISYTYEGKNDSRYKTKYSVSEIKHQAMEDAFGFESDAAPVFLEQDNEEYVPSFMRNDTVSKETPVGALYGSAMHRVMECLDFTEDNLADSLKAQLDYMSCVKSVSDEEMKLVSKKKIDTFLHSSLADRMKRAALQGQLYKEQPFVCNCRVDELFSDTAEADRDISVLVQGIIDVFFIEDDGIVLMDYKTDRVDEADELVLRYEKQLALYGQAIGRAYKLPVKEILIYSFYFDEVIPCMTSLQ